MLPVAHRLAIIVGLLLFLAAGCASAPLVRGSSDSLSQLRASVRDGEESPKKKDSRKTKPSKRSHSLGVRIQIGESQRGHCEDDDSESLSDALFQTAAIGAFYLAASPFTVPYHCLEDDDLDDVAHFPSWPYDATDGSMIVRDPDLPGHRTFAGRLQVFGATDFDDLQRYQVRLLAENTSRFGVDTETGLFRQTVPGGHDELWLGDFNLTYRFAQSEHVQFRAGIGANWLADSVRGDAGFNFTYQVDVFPREPWTASALIDVGTLGDASLFHGRGTVGVMVRQWEIFTGYDYLRIGNFDTHGLLGGLTLHF